jgi:hypothetical protein
MQIFLVTVVVLFLIFLVLLPVRVAVLIGRLQRAVDQLASGVPQEKTLTPTNTKPANRHRFSFRTLPLLIAATIVALVLGPLANECHRAKRQAAIVARLRSIGAVEIIRLYQRQESLCFPDRRQFDGAAPPIWAIQLFGAEFGTYVKRVAFPKMDVINSGDLGVGVVSCQDRDLVSLTDLVGLNELSLEYTEITDKGLEHVGKLKELAYLSVADTAIDGSGLKYLKDLPNLRQLDLRGTNLKIEHFAAISEFPSLEGICLPSGVTDEFLRPLQACHLLRRLDLEDTQVTASGLQMLSSMPHLSSIYLSRLSSNAAGVAAIKKIPTLRALRMCGKGITVEDLAAVGGLTQLKQLDLNEFKTGEYLSENSQETITYIEEDAALRLLSSMKHLKLLNLGDFSTQINLSDVIDLPDTVIRPSADRHFRSSAQGMGGGGGMF